MRLLRSLRWSFVQSHALDRRKLQIQDTWLIIVILARLLIECMKCMCALASDTAKREPVEQPLVGLMPLNGLFLCYALFVSKV